MPNKTTNDHQQGSGYIISGLSINGTLFLPEKRLSWIFIDCYVTRSKVYCYMKIKKQGARQWKNTRAHTHTLLDAENIFWKQQGLLWRDFYFSFCTLWC